jgi:penicillin amidase
MRAALVLATLIVFVGLGLFARVCATLPVLEGERRVTGLDGPVRVLRDENAVPHIFAKSRADAFFGLGHAHAEERLWQMHLARLRITGRLTEVYGQLALENDIRMRALGYAERARVALENLPDEARDLLEAYASGVNAYLESEDFRGPPEGILTQVSIPPWTALDCLHVLFSFWPTLAKNLEDELRYHRIRRIAGERVAAELRRPFPSTGHVALELEDLVRTLGPRARAGPLATATTASWLSPTRSAPANSNNWVVGPERSASGAPLLANDPHLGLSLPSVWYLAHLSYPGEELAGVTVAGAPGIVIGHNQHVAWGVTAAAVDTDDYFIEALHPEDPTRYRTPQGYASFETREEVFRVRFAGEARRTLKTSRHGPVLPREVWAEPGDEDGFELAVRSTVHLAPDESFLFFFGLNHARSWADALEAAEHCGLPPQNMVLATKQGDIGYMMVGAIPHRGPRHASRGLWPAEGANPDNDWLGTLPWAERPRVLNPRAGALVTANGRIVPEGFAHPVTAAWRDPGRAARIEALLEARAAHDLDTFAAIQLDVGSTKVFETLPFLLETSPRSERARRALALLRAWDGQWRRDAPQPALYAAFMHALTARIATDELGPAWPLAAGRRPEIVRDAFRGPLAAWCDDGRTPRSETCRDLLAPSLEAALEGLEAHFGDDYAAWRWGEQLRIVHRHLGLGFLPGLGALLNTETSGQGGPSTPNVGYYLSRALPAIEGRRHGPSLRFLADLADLDASRFVLSAGQSGHFLSPHYDDLQARWIEGDYITISTDRRAVEASAESTLNLVPEG